MILAHRFREQAIMSLRRNFLRLEGLYQGLTKSLFNGCH